MSDIQTDCIVSLAILGWVTIAALLAALSRSERFAALGFAMMIVPGVMLVGFLIAGAFGFF